MRAIHAALTLVVASAIGGAYLCTQRDVARADAPDGRFTSMDCEGTACVRDNVTRLTWKKAEEPTNFTFTTAPMACVAPWRVPTIRELQSIVDVRQPLSPMIDKRYFTALSTSLWSSTPNIKTGSVPAGYRLNFQFGTTITSAQTNNGRVRCVRGPS